MEDVTASDYTMSIDRTVNEWLIGENVEANCRGLIESTSQILLWKD
jgi:hypothetical protein